MKYILTFLFCAITSLPATAGNKEPSLVKGDISATLAVSTFFFPMLDESYVQLGPYSLSVDYQLSKRFGVSALVHYSYYASQMGPKLLRVDSGGVFNLKKLDYAATQVMYGSYLSGHYWFVNRNRLGLSCGLGVGLYNRVVNYDFAEPNPYFDRKYKGNVLRFWMRLRLIDVKVRVTKNFSVFGGFGASSDGYLSAGLNYKITGHEE